VLRVIILPVKCLLSINKLAYGLVEELLEAPEYYGVAVERLPSGATVIDTGLEASGGYEAGLMTTRVAMGGAGTASLGYADFGGLKLPTVVVSTDHPAIALFGAQLAGWRIKPEGYTADGSGPARALALKPKKVFQKSITGTRPTSRSCCWRPTGGPPTLRPSSWLRPAG